MPDERGGVDGVGVDVGDDGLKLQQRKGADNVRGRM